VSQLVEHPVVVGRGGVDAFLGGDAYTAYAAQVRQDYLLRVSARGQFAGRQPRGSVSQALALYATHGSGERLLAARLSLLGATSGVAGGLGSSAQLQCLRAAAKLT
jgi:hypothetical protein